MKLTFEQETKRKQESQPCRQTPGWRAFQTEGITSKERSLCDVFQEDQVSVPGREDEGERVTDDLSEVARSLPLRINECIQSINLLDVKCIHEGLDTETKLLDKAESGFYRQYVFDHY